MDELENDLKWLKEKTLKRNYRTKKEEREAKRAYKKQSNKKRRQYDKWVSEVMVTA
jgi:hypothetical protein